MKNKLLRMIEIIQDGYPESLLAAFKTKKLWRYALIQLQELSFLFEFININLTVGQSIF